MQILWTSTLMDKPATPAERDSRPPQFVFPAGYHRFHKNQLFNFQLNRWYSLGYTDFEECAEAGKHLRTFSGLPLDLNWEKPLKAVLDHFRLDHVTVLGLSMGEWLCLRASAFEPDVLILSGSEDHFIPLKMHRRQLNAFPHVRSVTGRVFTKEEHAQNHYQIGNIRLALDVMITWIEEKQEDQRRLRNN